MIAERFQASVAARRGAALLLLFAALWIVSPVFTGPWERWTQAREALAQERTLGERRERIDARRAEVGALAGQPDAPFLVAPDAMAAAGLLTQRLMAAVPAEALRIESLGTDSTDPRPGAPVRATIAFTATQGGFYAFMADLETRPPFLRVDDLAVSSRREPGGALILSGTASISTVALMRGQP